MPAEMDSLGEGDAVAVFFEDGDAVVSTSDRYLDWNDTGDMETPVDEDLNMEVSMQSKGKGKFSAKSIIVTVRKKKKKAAGKKSGAGHKTLGTGQILLHKVLADPECSSGVEEEVELTWTADGEEVKGRGACVYLSVVLVPASLLIEEDSASLGSKGSKSTSKTSLATTTAAAAASTSSSSSAATNSLFGNASTASSSSSAGSGGKGARDTAREVQSTTAAMQDTRQRLQQRGEQLDQMANQSAELQSGASDYAKLARKLGGGGGGSVPPITPTKRIDHAAAIAARHDKSNSISSTSSGTSKVDTKQKKTPTSNSAAGGKTASSVPVATTKHRQLSKIEEESEDEVADEAGDDDDDHSNDAEGGGAGGGVSADNVFDIDLDDVLVNDLTEGDEKGRGRGSADSSRGGSKGGLRAASVDSSPGAVLDVEHEMDDPRNKTRNNGKATGPFAVNPLGRLGEGLSAAGQTIRNQGQSIVQHGGKHAQSAQHELQHLIKSTAHASTVVLGGVKKVIHHATDLLVEPSSHGSEGVGDDDGQGTDGASSPKDGVSQSAKILASYYTASEFSHPLTSPSAQNLTPNELSCLEELERVRLENLNLRETAMQFEIQIAKLNFFADELQRLEGETSAADAALTRINVEISSLLVKLKEKSTECASMRGELGTVKLSNAAVRNEVDRLRREEGILESDIEALLKSLPKEMTDVVLPSQAQPQRPAAPPSGAGGGGRGGGGVGVQRSASNVQQQQQQQRGGISEGRGQGQRPVQTQRQGQPQRQPPPSNESEDCIVS